MSNRKMTRIATLGLTIWGEAQADGQLCMEGVASVVINRMRKWKQSVTASCMLPSQFDSWEMLSLLAADHPGLLVAEQIARQALTGQLKDLTGGANAHYPVYVDPPYWAKRARFTCQLGNHRFYQVGDS